MIKCFIISGSLSGLNRQRLASLDLAQRKQGNHRPTGRHDINHNALQQGLSCDSESIDRAFAYGEPFSIIALDVPIAWIDRDCLSVERQIIRLTPEAIGRIDGVSRCPKTLVKPLLAERNRKTGLWLQRSGMEYEDSTSSSWHPFSGCRDLRTSAKKELGSLSLRDSSLRISSCFFLVPLEKYEFRGR